ncbi:MAG: hypothetical protein LLF98_01970 [Clostridium sp.]|uniref:hypothetical protein n=1 Tax=Clostridium sp. TaxID=1506 RepID=UPI0025B90995|nr:hypothetical protein [Clostridium sp.]MCE5220048.1 hypothetical protein [Clostridium sp.]
MEKVIEKIEKWIIYKISQPTNQYNQFTFEWSRGYKKALYDLKELINEWKK